MSTGSSAFPPSTARPRITETNRNDVMKKLENGQHYDAYSMVCTYVRRCLTRARHEEASRLCHTFGVEFIKKERYDLAAELGDLLVQVYVEFDLPVTEERISFILDLFEPRPPVPEVTRHRFIEHALKWVIDETGTESDYALRLHRIAGLNYQKEKLFGRAQGHLIFCGDGEVLSQLIVEWRQEGYYSERELFLLRLILLLLAKGDVDVADKTLQSQALGLNFDSPHLPPAIQFAYLLTEACKDKNADFFDLLTSKYSLVLRRDKLFSELVGVIDKKVLGRQPTNGDLNLLNVISGLFSGPNGSAQQLTAPS